MIGSFWNLCRACPSMPVDKQLHSEYRSTYRWHEFTGNSRPEVVRRAPAPNPSQFVGPTNEPPLPRRKKCPELAYKSHEFIIGSEYTDARRDASAHRLARSEERGGTPSRRSKSEGPPVVPNGRAYPIATEIDGTTRKQAGESNGLLKKTISKLSTEYRLQFVWPTVRRIKGGGEATSRAAAGDYPRKSISLGALRSGGQSHSHTQNQSQSLTQTQNGHTHHTMMGGGAGLPTVHKKRTTNQKEATLHELEPLVSDTDDRKTHEKQVTIVERKTTSRPFSQAIDQERLNHFITKKENYGFADAAVAAAVLKDEVDNRQQAAESGQVVVMNGSAPPHSKPNLDLWFKEMVELRKKAGEYKCRGWGIEIDPELYKKQKDLWDQVSKRSSLSALSLASTVHRPITKEEKEQENNKKSTPLQKAQKPRVPGQAFLIDNKDEISALPARFSNIRHHLERTTGPDVEEGALLPSPTREKLMPAITKRESESQRGSPKKTALSRHGSPQKGSPQKGSPKKVLKTTLSTTFQSRIKSSSLPPPNGRVASAPPATAAAAAATRAATAATSAAKSALNANQPHANQSQSSQAKSGSGKFPKPSATSAQQQQQQQMRKKDKDRSNSSCIGSGSHVGAGSGSQANSVKHLQNKQKQQQLQQQQQQQKQQQQQQPQQQHDVAAATAAAATSAQNPTRPATINIKRLTVPGQDRKLAENDGEDGRETAISISSCSPQPPVPEVPEEPLVKSPPEPTRVKSPEQIIMRSPDPVNWTVPLDTGKTFTVTQNVKDGENYSRPQSEIKASTPVEKPPPPPQSAPPQLTEQAKMDAWKSCSPTTSAAIYGKTLTPHATPTGQPGGAVRCTAAQDQPPQQPDPAMSSSSSTGTATASTARTTAAEVLERARDRFDRFWGSSASKEESV
ncbi:proteoglycan 4 isoform X4 [Drosophila suzukii]|uniref:Nuclear protein MDM1 n=1 Tax=Drosophila suzukii TaxID=28584 RepID=A0AB40DFP1_DROSZ